MPNTLLELRWIDARGEVTSYLLTTWQEVALYGSVLVGWTTLAVIVTLLLADAWRTVRRTTHPTRGGR